MILSCTYQMHLTCCNNSDVILWSRTADCRKDLQSCHLKLLVRIKLVFKNNYKKKIYKKKPVLTSRRDFHSWNRFSCLHQTRRTFKMSVLVSSLVFFILIFFHRRLSKRVKTVHSHHMHITLKMSELVFDSMLSGWFISLLWFASITPFLFADGLGLALYLILFHFPLQKGICILINFFKVSVLHMVVLPIGCLCYISTISARCHWTELNFLRSESVLSESS